MKYIDADRLREELQKSKTELKVGNYYLDNSEQAVGYENALIDFESLLDTLEEPDKDLPLPEDTLIFRKGVEEGRRLEREDIEKEWLEDRGGCFLDGVNEGKKAMKEQMMKEAVEAKIYGYDDGSFELIASWLDMPNNSIYKDGDKVRIIIVKEDGQ